MFDGGCDCVQCRLCILMEVEVLASSRVIHRAHRKSLEGLFWN